MQTIQQIRAAYALQSVEAVNIRIQSKDPNDKITASEYKSYASSLPAMIKMNGLGQAAAFFCSKAAGIDSKAHAYRALYDSLSNWLTDHENNYVKLNQPYKAYDDLLTGITQSDMQTYMLAQAEALAYLDWVKKFAKAYMED